jgi:hypothetical protein
MNREYLAFAVGWSLMASYTILMNEIEFRKLKENKKKIEP